MQPPRGGLHNKYRPAISAVDN